jgi:hypothetical protein
MVFSVSPAVTITENDFTSIVPNIATTAGAYVGPFQWGPVLQRTIIESENAQKKRFGEPNADIFTHWFSAANYLAYAANLNIVRVVGASAVNAVAEGTASLVKNEDHYNESFVASGEVMIAKYPGTLGNSLGVIMLDSGNFTGAVYDIDDDAVAEDIAGSFPGTPGTSTYVANRGGSLDEMHIMVYDKDGTWTGTKGTVLERHAYVSKANDAKKSDGTSAYYVDVLNDTSDYVWFASHPSDPTMLGDSGNSNWGSVSTNTIFDVFATGSLNPGDAVSLFSGGVDDNVAGITDGILMTGADLFADADAVNVGLFITGPASAVYVNHVVQNIAEVRKDFVVFASPLRANVVNNAGSEDTDIVTWRGTITNSSYVFMDMAWKYQYDRYAGVKRFIPLNGDTAGLHARADYTNDVWFTGAGYNRGIYKNIIKLSWDSTKAKRDILYARDVNPCLDPDGYAPILFGDKTGLGKPSAFDRIGVRRTFIVLEKAIATAAKFQLFEFNDEFTRSQFKSLIEPYLRDVMGRRGITDFKVVCNTSNNTPVIIQRNEFVGDIYIKPNYSINYIQLNFNATALGVSFEEVGG